MVNLKVKISKLTLPNPVLVASGTFGHAREFEKFIDLKKLGGVVTKTITLKPRFGNPPVRIVETPSGMINAIGLQNPGVEKFIEEKLPYLRKLKIPILVSIMGYRIEELVALVKRLEKAGGFDGYELNLSCPNVPYAANAVGDAGGESPILFKENHLKKIESRSPSTPLGMVSEVEPRQDPQSSVRMFAHDENLIREAVLCVRKYTSKVLIAKLGPDVSDVGKMARAAEKAGADAVSLINTFIAMVIDVETRRPVLANKTGGLSGPCIKPIAVRMVWETAKAVKIPVIGIGGIMNAHDALEFLIAGASAIQVGTANFMNPQASIEILDGLKDFMRKNKIDSVSSLIGSLKEGPA